MAVLAVLTLSLPARAEKGAMQIGLGYHYFWPDMDAAGFEPGPGYNAIFHYWLNDTTTIMAGIEQTAFTHPVDVAGGDEKVVFNSVILEVGTRYHPELDFFMMPYVEGGLAYQIWNTQPSASFMDARNGSNPAYFAGAGFDWELSRYFMAGFGGRYYYMPMAERIESSAVLKAPPKDYNVDVERLTNVGYVSAGIELVFRFK